MEGFRSTELPHYREVGNMNRGQGRVYFQVFQFLGFSFSLNSFCCCHDWYSCGNGYNQISSFCARYISNFWSLRFFLFKQKKILFKINSKLDVVMKFFFENIVDLSVNY